MSNQFDGCYNALIQSKFQEARSRSTYPGRAYLFEAEFYCQSATCPAREVTVRIKDHDDALMEMLKKKQGCPICGEQLKIHSVEG